MTSLDAVFNPDRVALVGASDRPGKLGTLLWRNLATFKGEVVPITRSASQIDGRMAYADFGAVDGPVDLAVVAVPAGTVPTVARDAAANGVRALVVLSGGFAETGPAGAALQEELAVVARTAGVRVVGPNCFGVQNAEVGLNASIAARPSGEAGGVALITQSGAYGMALNAVGGDERLRFGKIYASGNKVDIGDHEVIEYLRTDPATDLICVFAESVGDGRGLARAVRAAVPTTPVIIVKTGRSEAGGRAARSHTGALAGSDALFRAAMRQAGAVSVRSGAEMLDAARTLASQPTPAGRRAAVVTNSGGTGVELVDLLADEGVDVPELSGELRRRLGERLPTLASPRNPIDITPVWSRFAELYPWLIETLARSGEVDLVVPVLLQRSAMDADTVVAVRDAVRRLRRDGVAVPVYVCWVAPRGVRGNADLLQEAGIPCIEWPDRTAGAVGHAVRYAERSHRVAPLPELPPPDPTPIATGPLPSRAAHDLLERHGIPLVATAWCDTADGAVAAAERLGYPVVAKTADPAVAHRTEAGGVRLGLRTADAVVDAYADLARIDPAVLVQPLVDGVELVAGGARDPDFGPVVMVGIGGTDVEVDPDVAFALAPVGELDAVGMVAGLRGARRLAGFRGAEPVDLDAVHAVVRRVGDLIASHPRIAEIDLNPLLARADGACAVDWTITVD